MNRKVLQGDDSA